MRVLVLRNNLDRFKISCCFFYCKKFCTLFIKVDIMADMFLKTTIAIRFNLLQVCSPMAPFVFTDSFLPSFSVLSCCFYVSINLEALAPVWILINFCTRNKKKQCASSTSRFLIVIFYCIVLHFIYQIWNAKKR